jgi:hypothetical protein
MNLALVKSFGIKVQWTRDVTAYRPWLKLAWAPTTIDSVQNAARIESEHTHRITGGRTTGEMIVSDAARRRGRVDFVSKDAKYAFIRDPDLRVAAFTCPKWAEVGCLTRGASVTYVAIQTPRGVQARSVRRAL